VDQYAGVPFGIVVFKGVGEIFLPITADTTAIGSYLTAIGTYLITTPGTDIEAGLNRAVLAFPSGTDTRRVIVLFSDGGSLTGRSETAAGKIGSTGVRLVVVGAGTDAESPIPDGEGYIVDEDGNRVLTNLNVSELEAIASAAGGFYFTLDSGVVIDDVGDSIRSIRSPVRFRDRYRLALLASLVMLFSWVALRSVRWKGVF
jgi:Ca-activated chloride channel family protein